VLPNGGSDLYISVLESLLPCFIKIDASSESRAYDSTDRVIDESGMTLMVRSCALDSGTLTTDSEIIRMSHCGGFYFDDK